jgi:hypothetical protein
MNARWHAGGLRWLASLLQSAAAYLESAAPEATGDCAPPNCVDSVRLRAHLRGLY